MSLLNLSPSLLINTLSYLSPREKYSASQVCRKIHDSASHPCQWRDISIFSKQQIHQFRFSSLIIRASQLRVLCLKFCPSVSGDTLAIIAEEANPFYLRELYLDGCDKIND